MTPRLKHLVFLFLLPLVPQLAGAQIPVNVNVSVDKEAREEIAAMRTALQDSLRTLADAIPGGRYTRLIEDLHGGDPGKKKAAQEFLKSLAGLDPAVEYSVSLWFEFDPRKPLHAFIFRGALTTKDEIEVRYKQANLTNAAVVGNTPLGDPTPDQIRQEIREALNEAVGKIPASVALPPDGQPADSAGRFNYELARAAAEEAGRNRAAMVNDLLRAFDAFYRDWQAHGGKLAVKALLHKTGEPQKPLPGTDLITFESDEWKLINLQDSQQPPRSYRWAVHTMTDTLLLSPGTAQQMQAMRDALEKWEKARTDAKP